MPKKKKPLDELLERVETTYYEGLKISVRVHRKLKHFKETSEGRKPVFTEHEIGERVQVYVTAENRIRKSKLNRLGKELWLYIQDQIDYKKPYIWINKIEYKKEMDIEESTYKKAVKELVEHDFLRRTDIEDTYLFDPKLIWKGDRAEYFDRFEGVVKRVGDLEGFAKAGKATTFAKEKASHSEFDTQDGSASNPTREFW